PHGHIHWVRCWLVATISRELGAYPRFGVFSEIAEGALLLSIRAAMGCENTVNVPSCPVQGFDLGRACMGRLWGVATAALAVMLNATSAAQANDSTYSCSKPPDKAARVAVHPGSTVSFTQNNQDNTCTFSVNGAVATSPPPKLVIDALNVFRD